MRDARKRLAKRSRQQRRVIVAVIMMASTPVMADGPSFHTVRNLPPLPLTSITDGNLIHSNPFCKPTHAAGLSPVRQASGSDTSSIRLKRIGAAIGLQSIDSSAPTVASSPAMTIETVGPAAVRKNPLVESTHHANPELVETKVVDRASTNPPTLTADEIAPSRTSTVGGSTILLIPSAPIKPHTVGRETDLQGPSLRVPAQHVLSAQRTLSLEHVMADEPIIVEEPALTSPSAASVADAALPSQPVAQPLKPKQDDEATEHEIVESVRFSMSDRPDPSGSSSESVNSHVMAAEPFDVASTSGPELVVEVPEKVPEKVPGKVPEKKVVEQHFQLTDAPSEPTEAADTSVELSVAEPIDLGDPFLIPIDSEMEQEPDAPIVIYRSEPAVALPVPSPEATLHTKRYRPPVAVKSVPLDFERPVDASDSLVHSVVQPVKGLNLDGPNLEVGPGLEAGDKVKLTPLYLSRAQVRSLTVGGRVRGVKVADENVCQTFAAGPNQLKLIGTGIGVTRLVVWADTDDANEPTRMRTFVVHVNDAIETNGDVVGNKAELLVQTIQKTFPNCSVTVKPYRDQLVVAGRCDSETTARQIIRMVRKTCLVPVQDKLVVR